MIAFLYHSRLVKMVHLAAFRKAGGNVSRAENIMQEVFTELAWRVTTLAAQRQPVWLPRALVKDS
jgi:hypothetical protein